MSGNTENTLATGDLRVDKPSVAIPELVVDDASSDSSSSKRDIVIFSDFDGTIMLGDTGHVLFDAHGCGEDERKKLDAAIHSGALTFRDASEQMWGSLAIPFEDGFELMKEKMQMDEGFRDFHDFCLKRNIPFNVISAGLKPVLRRLLDEFIGTDKAKHIDIVSNDLRINDSTGEWQVEWRDDTPLGHDKSQSIKEARAQAGEASEGERPPLIVFIGDGVSDLPAAQEADVLFARSGLRLEEYCIAHKIPFIPFETFADIKRDIIAISDQDKRSKRETQEYKYFNRRANFWRRASSKDAGTMEAWKSAISRSAPDETLNAPIRNAILNTPTKGFFAPEVRTQMSSAMAR